MTFPVDISYHGIEPSDAISAKIKERCEHMERFSSHIESCRVVFSSETNRHTSGGNYRVHISLNLPGDHIEVSHEPGDNRAHDDAYIAIRDAFQAAERQLTSHAKKVQDRHHGRGHA